jgi:DNA-binding NarL/FixJ family response regulator
MIRVLLVDDQDLVRAGFRLILSAEADVDVVGEAADGAAAVAAAREQAPDVVLMDVQMPGMDGIAATRAIVGSTAARVVVLTTFDRDDYLFAALEAGASGFLLKNAGPEDLVAAVRVVAAGEALLDPKVTRRVIRRFAGAAGGEGGGRGGRAAPVEVVPSAPNGSGSLTAPLTPREAEVLALVAEGLSNGEIAERLVVGEATVKTHVSHLLAKLQARDRVQLVVQAHRGGLAPVGD